MKWLTASIYYFYTQVQKTYASKSRLNEISIPRRRDGFGLGIYMNIQV